MKRLLEIFFLPPMAVARLGAGATPVESFRWSEGRNAHETRNNTIVPDVTLRVREDGGLEAFLPESISFKDEHGVRPVAPFLELWARVQNDDMSIGEEPVTLALLHGWGTSPSALRYRVTAGNRKAAQRTNSAACAFIGRVELRADDFRARDILAVSPRSPDDTPLVAPDRPVPLGRVQALRPEDRRETVAGQDVDYSVLRLRFTPPSGTVYGPPQTTVAPASPVAPGVFESPLSHYGRIHEIVPAANRILNDGTPWSTQFVAMKGDFEDPTPPDSYDGGNVGSWKSWGVVDDTSDVLIDAHLALFGRRFQAQARVLVGPPDFAPDRRPFYSLTDDLLDREVTPEREITADNARRIWASVLDVFRRAFETMSLLNVDASRTRALEENAARLNGALFLIGLTPLADSAPRIDGGSMTALDEPQADRIKFLTMPQPRSMVSANAPDDPLPYTHAANFVHAQLTDETVLLDFLRRRGERALDLIRPAFGSFAEFSEHPPAASHPRYRDPRSMRDAMNDMRMPPYMRDAALYPLSLTRKQYIELMAFIEFLQAADDARVRDWLGLHPNSEPNRHHGTFHV